MEKIKRILFLPLLFFITSLDAKEICTLTSEVEPDVNITLKYTGSGGGIGTLNYKNKPSIGFDVGIWNGYGGQYYVARSYLPESLNEEKTYQERTKNTKKIRQGHFINFVGNQLGRMGHLNGTRGHYDRSTLLDKRREFMAWWSKTLIEQGLRI